MKKWILKSLVLFLAASICLPAAEVQETTKYENIVSVEKLPQLGIEIITLNNGIRVCLKPTKYEEHEVLMRFTAIGGFADTHSSKRGSVELAVPTVFHSGIGHLNYDQFHAHLYNHEIEFQSQIKAFSRVVEGASSTEEIEELFRLFNLYFTQSNFTEAAFEKVKENSLAKLKKRRHEGFRQYVDSYIALNTQNFQPLTPLTEADVKDADFKIAKDFFNCCFSHPEEFVCMIVGDIDSEQIKPFINQYLGSIPRAKKGSFISTVQLPSAYKGVKTKIVRNFNRSDAITRITFPISAPTTQDNIEEMEAMVGLIQIRLKDAIRKRVDHPFEVNVGLEFPYYPYLDSPWLTVQYISGPHDVKSVGQMILSEIKNLQINGVEEYEVSKLRDKTKKKDYLWKKDNNYWLTTMTNYLLWDWEVNGIIKKFDEGSVFKVKKMKGDIKHFISLDDYTIISAQP